LKEIVAYCFGEREFRVAEGLLIGWTRLGPFVIGGLDDIENLRKENVPFEVIEEDLAQPIGEAAEASANQVPIDKIIKGIAGTLVSRQPAGMASCYTVEIGDPTETGGIPGPAPLETKTENSALITQIRVRLTLPQAKSISKLPPVKRVSLKLASRQIRFSPATLYASADTSSWRRRLGAEPHKIPINPIPNIEAWVKELVDFETWQAADSTKPNKPDIYSALRTVGDREGRTYLGTESLPRLIEALYTLTYEQVRRGKLLEHDYGCDLEDAAKAAEGANSAMAIRMPEYLPACPKSRPIWVEVIALCQTIINLCRSVSSEFVHLEYGWRVNTYILNSLALGRLGRFTEARRCLNEANALLSKLPRRVDQVELAAIELRRAEVHVLEAIFLARLLNALCHVLLSGLQRYVEFPASARDEEGWLAENLRQIPCQEEIHHLLRLLLSQIGETGPSTQGNKAKKIASQWFAQYEMKWLCPAKSTYGPKVETAEDIVVDLVRNLAAHLTHIHFAQLDDAWVALEHAERLLAGRTRSSQWWGRLCTLRLRVFAEHWNEERLKNDYDRCLPKLTSKIRSEIAPKRCATMAFRRKIDYPNYFIALLRLGLAVWPYDPYPRLRLADYFMLAWRRWTNTPGKMSNEVSELTSEARMLLREAKKAYDGPGKEPANYALLNRYAKAVEGRVEAFIEGNNRT
jgi:hypothetical protein